MKLFSLTPYAGYALLITAASTAALSLLTCLSAAMVRLGDAPLQHAILTRQMAGRIPVTFFCGLFAVLLCDILYRYHKPTDPPYPHHSPSCPDLPAARGC